MEAFFRGSHTTNSVTCGLSKSYNQAAQVPSTNVTCKAPRSPSINCRIALVFVSITHSITIFPASFLTAIEMLSLCTSIPIYFLSFNMRVLLSVGVDANDQNLLQRGALLYCVVISECEIFRQGRMSRPPRDKAWLCSLSLPRQRSGAIIRRSEREMLRERRLFRGKHGSSRRLD